jgi:hypothetical protein
MSAMSEELRQEYGDLEGVIKACSIALSATIDSSQFSEGSKTIFKQAVSDLFDDLDGNGLYVLRHEIDDEQQGISHCGKDYANWRAAE